MTGWNDGLSLGSCIGWNKVYRKLADPENPRGAGALKSLYVLRNADVYLNCLELAQGVIMYTYKKEMASEWAKHASG